jgi:hypothetical protein
MTNRCFTLGLVLILIAILSSGCYFDSGTPWKSGKYELLWIDKPDDVFLSYDLGAGSSSLRIESTVFAVGSDEHYVVAQQHPHGVKSITNYYILDIARDSRRAEPRDVVEGPMTEVAFRERSAQLKLPPFSKVLESLE